MSFQFGNFKDEAKANGEAGPAPAPPAVAAPGKPSMEELHQLRSTTTSAPPVPNNNKAGPAYIPAKATAAARPPGPPDGGNKAPAPRPKPSPPQGPQPMAYAVPPVFLGAGYPPAPQPYGFAPVPQFGGAAPVNVTPLPGAVGAPDSTPWCRAT